MGGHVVFAILEWCYSSSILPSVFLYGIFTYLVAVSPANRRVETLRTRVTNAEKAMLKMSKAHAERTDKMLEEGERSAAS